MNGICFTEPMFKMIVGGLKTQTRRVVKPQPIQEIYPNSEHPKSWHKSINGYNDGENEFNPRYKVGQVLFLKEPYSFGFEDETVYKFSSEEIKNYKWENKLFMPAHYARYFIKITDVRCEHLQDISSEDCEKEGIRVIGYSGFKKSDFFGILGGQYFYQINTEFNTPREAYAALINKIHKRDIWKENPFIWVYDFVKCEKP